MRRPLYSFVLFLTVGSILGFTGQSRAEGCFLGDFDEDGDPWTIRTTCTGGPCTLDFILEATAESPAGHDFTIVVREGCCQVNGDGFYGTRVEMLMNPAYVDWAEATYATCTCCTDWFIDGHFKADADFESGRRYVIGTGTAEPRCDDTWWLCTPPHTFEATYYVDHAAPCEGNSIAMTVQCPASDAPAQAAAPIACLGAPSPNPVIDELRFGVELTRAGPVRVLVHDATGALVATLVDRELPAGRHAQSWHPVNARGDRLANGIYFLRLEAPGVRAARPFVVTR
jgi:hypothetical protein